MAINKASDLADEAKPPPFHAEHVGSIVRYLPGIRPHPESIGTLVVNTRVARLFPLEILHLLGYRKLRYEGDYLLVNRRQFDLNAPSRPSVADPARP